MKVINKNRVAADKAVADGRFATHEQYFEWMVKTGHCNVEDFEPIKQREREFFEAECRARLA